MKAIDLSEYAGMPVDEIKVALSAHGFSVKVAERLAQLVDGPPGFYDEIIELDEHGKTVSVNGVSVSS